MGERATDAALKAIAEPRRRAILRLVADDELAAGEIAAAFDVTRTAVSQHLTVLKNAGLVTERRLGTRRLYRARPEGLDGLREFLNEMWSASPDAARLPDPVPDPARLIGAPDDRTPARDLPDGAAAAHRRGA